MKFWLYQMKGDKRYINKQPFMTSLYNEGEANEYFEGAIIDDTSVIDPTFKFSRNNYWKRCNYLFCEDTLRYYYVTDVTLSNGFVYVKCHVDVLMTFKDSLLSKKVIAKRSGEQYNLYLNDDKYQSYAPDCERFLEFPDGFDKDTTEFVMCVVGNTNTNNNE